MAGLRGERPEEGSSTETICLNITIGGAFHDNVLHGLSDCEEKKKFVKKKKRKSMKTNLKKLENSTYQRQPLMRGLLFRGGHTVLSAKGGTQTT
jgi:hypothetical protein